MDRALAHSREVAEETDDGLERLAMDTFSRLRARVYLSRKYAPSSREARPPKVLPEGMLHALGFFERFPGLRKTRCGHLMEYSLLHSKDPRVPPVCVPGLCAVPR